jgi:Fe-S-cluster-containing dehydrogenase component
MEPAPAIAMACLLCEDPTCVRTCVKNAITQDEATGVISVDENKCTGCSWCALTCEFGAIHINPERKVAVACDLCDGDPRCVKICPHDALRFEPLEALYEKKREKAAIFYLLQKESKAD